MHWIRSYPSQADRSHHNLIARTYVSDITTETVLTDDYDYTPLGKIDDDVLLIEWDVAASKEDMELFAEHAAERPHEVLAAAHRLYHVAPYPVWAHRRYDGKTGKENWIGAGEVMCDLAAFGMIYLPRNLVRGFIADEAPERGRPTHVPRGSYADKRFTDQTFSMWHYRTKGQIRVDWGVRPVHLHYVL